jgi:nitrite reductase (NADH) small subunit
MSPWCSRVLAFSGIDLRSENLAFGQVSGGAVMPRVQLRKSIVICGTAGNIDAKGRSNYDTRRHTCDNISILRHSEMVDYHAGRLEEFKEGERRLIRCGDAEIGIFNVDGELHAWHNRCAHRGGPVCQGVIMKRVMEPVASDGTVRAMEYHPNDTHVVCPWHGYEYNLKTGAHPGHSALKLRKAKIAVRDGEVYVSIGRSTTQRRVRVDR